jgi:glucose-1-phosphate thymidylyltransferase
MKGEWFLTDAFQYMIDHGRKLLTAEVAGWYDCGKVETVLATNLHLLQHGRSCRPEAADGVVLVDPVRVAEGVKLENCTIGPNVSIDAGAEVRNSTLRDAIVGKGARVHDATVTHTLVGDEAAVTGGSLNNMVVAKDERAAAP